MKIRMLLPMLFLALSLNAQKKTVFIIVDGIPPDVLENLDLPAIKSISSAGGYTRSFVGGIRGTYSESPTISAVGYNHLLTGTWTNKHNVWGNGIEAPNYNYPTIFRIAKEVQPNLKTAIFSTWLDNRTKLVGDGLPATGHLHIDYAFDGFERDTLRFSHRKPTYIFDIDELVSREAARYIGQESPDLSWVYLEYTDDAGHRYGDSPEQKEAIQRADIQIGRVWEAVQERMAKYGEQWLIVVTTDHGRSAKDGKDHGGQSDRERTTWITTNAPALNSHFKEQPAMVDILPSICSFMDIRIPENIKSELDGVPFIGEVAVSNLHAEKLPQGDILLTWKALEPSTEAEIWITDTNLVKNGGLDIYRLLAKVKLNSNNYSVSSSLVGDGFHKILLKTPSNWVNIWIGK